MSQRAAIDHAKMSVGPAVTPAADGQSFPGVNYCNDWTTTLGTTSYGDTDFVDGWWLFVAGAINNPTKHCGAEFAIYCLEQE